MVTVDMCSLPSELPPQNSNIRQFPSPIERLAERYKELVERAIDTSDDWTCEGLAHAAARVLEALIETRPACWRDLHAKLSVAIFEVEEFGEDIDPRTRKLIRSCDRDIIRLRKSEERATS